ncbi:MarR family winged helix-turn-helix transcriptional regulator [Ktedonospora formicarum]|uniref:MarR family transcriptional regulator n=1 Tax=Ktedonospora formicarum TaxID=2778364 RepID=A0A8J3I6D6_9CHLR|nr:MarR family transcriptional regulator [Ktedonospora formicarum]GHO49476.1 MarR family transcriptional regulator [Ktedonospora formicarum]
MTDISASMYGMFALLSMALRTLVDELQEHSAQAGFGDVRPAHGFVFQRLAPDGATGNELAEHLGITKQAASQMIDYLEERGYVARQPHPTDKRGKLIVLTSKGWDNIHSTEAIMSKLEAQWANLIGRENLEQLRFSLRHLVFAANEGTLPALKPIW